MVIINKGGANMQFLIDKITIDSMGLYIECHVHETDLHLCFRLNDSTNYLNHTPIGVKYGMLIQIIKAHMRYKQPVDILYIYNWFNRIKGGDI